MGNYSKGKKNIAITGAGAAGLVAAFFALKAGHSVTVYEKNEIAGKKLRITGNGRCNFTNEDMSVSHYGHFRLSCECSENDADEAFRAICERDTDLNKIAAILKKNGKEEYIAFLNRCGIPCFQKNGYYYPLSERAGEMTDVLVKILIRNGVKFRFRENIRSIERSADGKFLISGEKFDAVILACGGKAFPSTGSDGGGFKIAREFGHTVGYTYPVLVPLKADPAILKMISGVRIKAVAYGLIDRKTVTSDRGEVQFTDTTISGIPVFQLSRHLTKAIEEKKDVRIRLDVLPDVEDETAEEFVLYRKKLLSGASFEELFEGIFPKKYYEMLLKQYHLNRNNPNQNEPDQNETDFIRFSKKFEFRITGHTGYENAQCTRGGVPLSEVKENLESAKIPDLYIIGEMLDVDGDCGGYNLQWAFSSGKTAGENV